MPAPKTSTTSGSKNSMHGLGALLLVIVVAVAIVTALVMSGVRLFGSSDDLPTGDKPSGEQQEQQTVKTEAWPFEEKLNEDFNVGDGFLILPDSTYEPNDRNLQALYGNIAGQATLSDTSLKLNKTAVASLKDMLTALNGDCSFTEILNIHTAYSSSTTNDDYRSALTVRFRLKDNENFKDLAEATGDNPVDWMEDYAWQYGFILRYPEGAVSTGKEDGVADVYRYVGVPHAYYIANLLEIDDDTSNSASDDSTAEQDGDNDNSAVPALEDYIALVRKKTPSAPLIFEVRGTEEDNGRYCVFYIAASETAPKVPEDSELVSVSGVGDGYIVTVRYALSSNNQNQAQ